MQTKIRAIQRGTTTEIDAKAGQGGDLGMSQFLPPFAQLCAAGAVFAFDMTAGTSKIPVAAFPTTSPEWGIYNANAGGGKHLVLLRVAALQTSGTAGTGIVVGCATGKAAATLVSANYSATIVSCLDGTSKTPNAFLANNPTIVGGTPAWVYFDPSDSVASGPIGKGVVAKVDGLIIAPPGGELFIEIVAPLGGACLYACTAVIAEVQLDLA